MEQTLKTLQDLQMKAFKKGIHSFNVTARRYTDEDQPIKGLVVTIFLTGSDDDDDYGAFYFYNDIVDPADNFRELNNLKAFIGEE